MALTPPHPTDAIPGSLGRWDADNYSRRINTSNQIESNQSQLQLLQSGNYQRGGKGTLSLSLSFSFFLSFFLSFSLRVCLLWRNAPNHVTNYRSGNLFILFFFFFFFFQLFVMLIMYCSLSLSLSLSLFHNADWEKKWRMRKKKRRGRRKGGEGKKRWKNERLQLVEHKNEAGH